MSVECFVYLLSGLLTTCGLLAFFVQKNHQEAVYRFLRKDSYGLIFFAIASIWFIWKLAHLGEADFGQYKQWLIGIFLFVFIGCSIYWRDFLIVRALAMLYMMLADVMLDIGYMSDRLIHPLTSALIYIGIIIALFFGTYPYWARDVLPYLFAKKCRLIKIAGCILVLYSGILLWFIRK